MHYLPAGTAIILLFAVAPASAQWVNVPPPPQIDFGAPLRDLQAAQQAQDAQEQARAAQAQARELQQQTYLQQQQLELQRQQLAEGQAQQRVYAQQLESSNTVRTIPPITDRVAEFRAIAKPATGDIAEDEYVYGYRMWEAGLYPDAQQQLALFLDRFPNHLRISFARNLLGRTMLDSGDPRSAATYFFGNYQTDKNGARAADSLLYLAEAMVALDDNRRACIALAEFNITYPALAIGRLREEYDRITGRVRCSS